MVAGLTCGACMWLVKRALAAEPDLLRARASLSARRLTLLWRGPAARANHVVALVARFGLRATEDAPGRPVLLHEPGRPASALAGAASLARASRHLLALALGGMLAAGTSVEGPFTLFCLPLFAFGVLFALFLVKRTFDEAEEQG